MTVSLTWRAAAWHLHVELHSVHAQDGVTNMTEHVVAGLHSHESWQLQQLLQLGLPPYKKTRGMMRINKHPRSVDFKNTISPFRV